MNIKHLRLKNGVCIVPEGWITIMLDDLTNCVSAHVICCRNECRFKVPRFVVLTALPYGQTVPDELLAKMYSACADSSPLFMDAFNRRAEAGPNDSCASSSESLKKWQNSPVFGYFTIPEYGDPDYWNPDKPDYTPTCGAAIFRDR